jgi:glycosyltransferase involved in cell wall biosynthesis
LRCLALVPVHNEVASLAGVVAELRDQAPALDVLVIDDASTDGTGEVLPRLGVRWLQLGQHVGLGGALRAGLRWARALGYGVVVRIDGDGQHPASEIHRLLAVIESNGAAAVLGSRFLERSGYTQGRLRGALQALLAWALSRLTGSKVTDPTSGFWAFGPRAVRLLGDHYPPGYSEPELMLFLWRNRLTVAEVAVTMRARQGGRSTLTAPRAALALARTLLALVVVPLRRMVREDGLG